MAISDDKSIMIVPGLFGSNWMMAGSEVVKVIIVLSDN